MSISILWISAANDRGQKKLYNSNNEKYYRCRGCYYLLHHSFDKSSTKFTAWKRINRDPYILLITFGGLLFIAWSIVGILGALANNFSISKAVFLYNIVVCWRKYHYIFAFCYILYYHNG